jgi:hypothetical protein
VPEERIAPAVVEDQLDVETFELVATQPEDDDPLALVGDAADPPDDTGRPEGVGP